MSIYESKCQIEIDGTKLLHEQLNCQGYHGFGTGFELGYMQSASRKEGYCNLCPILQQCWDLHKGRVRTLMPDLTEIADEVYAEVKGPNRIIEFARRSKQKLETMIEPYTAVSGANMRDGARFAQGMSFDDHGNGTLRWPLEDLSGMLEE